MDSYAHVEWREAERERSVRREEKLENNDSTKTNALSFVSMRMQVLLLLSVSFDGA